MSNIGSAGAAIPVTVVVASALNVGPAATGSTLNPNVPRPPRVILRTSSPAVGGLTRSVYVQVTVSPDASATVVLAVGRSVLLLLAPVVEVQVIDVSCQPEGTCSVKFQFAPPAR